MYDHTKVACTTVKTVLLCMEGELSPEVLAGKVHHPNRGTHLGALDTPQVVEALSSPDWFRFSFVRNPYERLLSAYKSKLGSPNDSQYAWLRDEIRAEFDYPTREGTPATIAFRDLVAYLTQRPERVWRDGHFNSQTNILAEGLINYDYIGRFETFCTDFNRVLARLGVSEEAVELATENRNPTPQTPLPWVYDDKIADVVYELYRPDFEHFGYLRDSWMFPFT